MGSSIAKKLLKIGYFVKGCDSLIGGYETNAPKHENCDWLKFDIRETELLASHMDGCDAVIHTAALAYEGLSVFSPKLVTENIYSGTASVASAAIQKGLTKFVNSSSMARYGDGTPPFKETMILKPQDPYGLAKVQAEQLLNMLSEIHGIKVYHVVPHNIIGIGQRYDDPFRNVAAIFINRLLQGKSVFVYGDGQQRRSLSYVQDCVNPIIQLMRDTSFPSGETFNIGPDDNAMSIKELVTLVAKHCNITPEIVYMPGRPREVKFAWCSSDKAKKLLNYRPQTSLEDGLIEMIDWVKDRGVLPFKYNLPIEIVNEHTPKTWTEQLI